MDEIKKRLRSMRQKLSSVGRVRLLVGLAVALFFVWLISPAFHGLVLALYIDWPFFLVTLGGGLLAVYLWNIGDKDPAKVVALIAAVAAVAYTFTAAPLRDLKYLDSIEAQEIEEMPDTTGRRRSTP